MHVRIFMATSPNGYIARADGSEDWLSAENWKDFLAQVSETKNFIIGRETYEVVKRLYASYTFDDVAADCKIIVTRNLNYDPPAGYLIVHSPSEAIELLESRSHTAALVTGGGILNAAFLKAGLANELCLNIQPYIIGAGRPLFAEENYETLLELQDVKKLGTGRLQLWYKILNRAYETS